MSENPKTVFFGVGGGGCRCLNHLLAANLKNVEFIAANTDAQDLGLNSSPVKIQLGRELLNGNGAGGSASLGRKAALENAGEIAAIVENAEMVMISATLGGGTGSGAAPFIASLAHENGAMVVAFVSRPFRFEGKKRARVAADALRELKKYVDVLFEFRLDRLVNENEPEITVLEAFASLDQRICEAASCFLEMLSPGLISFDQQCLADMVDGFCDGYIAIGSGSGENMAAEAVASALADGTEKLAGEPLKGIIANFTCGPEFSPFQFHKFGLLVAKEFGDCEPWHFTVKIVDEMVGRLKLSLVFLRPRSR